MLKLQTAESTLVAVYDILNCGPNRRFSANGKLVHNSEYNCQNLPRVDRKNPKTSDALRNCLRAPEGFKVIVADQSGIELRVNHFLWRVGSSMALYAGNAQADLYIAFAATMYNKDPSEVTKAERQLAKVAQLGLGFGAGPDTFRKVAKTMGGIELTLAQATETVEAWRLRYYEITRGWRECHKALDSILAGRETAIDPGEMLVTCSEGIRLPSGRLIRYPDLRQESVPDTRSGRFKQEWLYANGRHTTRIYAGKITENCVQALARDSIFDCAVQFYRSTRLRPALRVHDELVYVVPEADADNLLAELQRIMRTPPKWWPKLVVWSEGSSAGTYGAAK